MSYLFAIVYTLASFMFTFWLISSTGNYWWIALLIFLLGGLTSVNNNQ